MPVALQRLDGQSSNGLSDAFCASGVWSAQLLAPVYFRHCREPLRAAVACLRRGVSSGMIASAKVDARPIGEIDRPLYCGPPGRAPFSELARKAQARWAMSSVPMRVYWATSQFARLYGMWSGQDELRRPELAGHDLLLSAVWLVYLRRHPQIALQHWQSERQLQFEHRRGRQLKSIPDALITTEQGSTAVEVLGQYPAEWIAHHCRGFAREKWRVAIW